VSKVQYAEVGERRECVWQALQRVLTQRQCLQAREVAEFVGQRHQLVSVEEQLRQLLQLSHTYTWTSQPLDFTHNTQLVS